MGYPMRSFIRRGLRVGTGEDAECGGRKIPVSGGKEGDEAFKGFWALGARH